MLEVCISLYGGSIEIECGQKTNGICGCFLVQSWSINRKLTQSSCALAQDLVAAVKDSVALQGEPAGEVQPQTAKKVLETDRLPADDLVAKAG